MARVKGPYSVEFPVIFTSKGDTTRDAFQKHMLEIARIYGILTDFDKDVANAESLSGNLTNHINNTNPHPNWTPSVSWGNVTGKPDLLTTGSTIAAAKVSGKLTGANIDAANVNGLDTFITGKIPKTGDGITEKTLSSRGYVKFANGLIMQWGNSGDIFPTGTYSFPKSFPSSCYSVQLTYKRVSETAFDDLWVQLISFDRNGFKCLRQGDDGNISAVGSGGSVEFFAIGA